MLVAIAVSSAACGSSDALAEQFKVLTGTKDRISPGTTAVIDTLRGPRIVELARTGKVIWQCAAPELKSGEIHRGADLEWIKADDSFLAVLPKSGIFRINRLCAVIWRYRTRKVSHDADLLPNGNVLFTFAWDTTADSQAVEIDPNGKIVWSWQAKGNVDPAWKDVAKARKLEQRLDNKSLGSDEQGFTHANSVQRLSDGDTLVSLRNYHRVVRVAPGGSVKRVYGPIVRVHDPTLLADGTLVAVNQFPMRVIALGGARRLVFDNPIKIGPIRTAEPLEGGNFLITGGQDIVEIDGNGEVVWRVKIYSNLGKRVRRGVYKAVHIAK